MFEDPAQVIIGILIAQGAMFLIAFAMSFTSAGRGLLRLTTIMSGAAAAASVFSVIVAIAVTRSIAIGDDLATSAAILAASSVALAIMHFVMRGMRMPEAHDNALDSPRTRRRAADELREILRAEGTDLDGRLEAARQERENFLYALEERHAKQIAGLAREYQHEAQTILEQLLDQLSAHQLQPMVEQRLAEHRRTIESELGAIDATAAGETLTTLKEQLAELTEAIAAAETRIAEANEKNPDADVETKVDKRLRKIEKDITSQGKQAMADLQLRMNEVQETLDAELQTKVGALEARVQDVGALLDEKIDEAANPLKKRMAEAQAEVDQRMNFYLEALNGRFGETENLLNERIATHEASLDTRVEGLEQGIDTRLAGHVDAIEKVLADHDRELQAALAEQSEQVASHFAGERDRIVADLADQTVALQERIAAELVSAEERARETVEATRAAWNQFTGELEERFAATRGEALAAAHQIAQAERETLEREMQNITRDASADIAAKIEQLGREAAWQRAQVERTVHEHIEIVQRQAQEALGNADVIFADVERIGNERVSEIRRSAEESLVHTQQYVEQLERSLGDHLEGVRSRASELGNELTERLMSIDTTSRQTLHQLETQTSQMVDSARNEIAAAAEGAVNDLGQRLRVDMTQAMQAAVDSQQRSYEQHLTETAQRIMQQVQGDLAGLAEHARGAVLGELDQIVSQAREQARQTQEQGFMQIMQELARQQGELAQQAREATGEARKVLDESLQENRRQLEEAMASMGAHMREELVRFHDEGQRRVHDVIERLRRKEHDLLRDEDRKLNTAREQLVRQHQGALERQVKDMIGGLSGSLSSNTTLAAHVEPVQHSPGTGFSADVSRPATPLTPQAPQAPQPPVQTPAQAAPPGVSPFAAEQPRTPAPGDGFSPFGS